MKKHKCNNECNKKRKSITTVDLNLCPNCKKERTDIITAYKQKYPNDSYLLMQKLFNEFKEIAKGK